MSGFRYFRYKWLMSALFGLKRWPIDLSSPEKVVWSLLFGFYLGLFPVLGSTTVLCLLFTLIFRLNLLTVQAVQFSLFPFQLVLINPFMKAGRVLFFSSKEVVPDVSASQFTGAEGWHQIGYLFESVAGGVLVWFLFSVCTGFFLYRFLLRFVSNYLSRENSVNKNLFNLQSLFNALTGYLGFLETQWKKKKLPDTLRPGKKGMNSLLISFWIIITRVC